MKKISHVQSGPNPVGPKNDLVERDIDTDLGGAGFNLTENTSAYQARPAAETEDSAPENHKIDDDVFKLLVDISDNLDSNQNEALASFSDFLIKKFSEAENVDYDYLFNKLILKINNADIVNTNDIIKKICKIYSRTIVLEFIKNKDKNKSKESAYKKIIHRADQYLSEE